MPNQQDQRRQRQIMAEIAELSFCLPGSLVARKSRCGNPTCACHHDPDLSWTRKVNGKTVTRKLSPTQAQRYQPWFDNARRLRDLTKELEGLSAQAAAK